VGQRLKTSYSGHTLHVALGVVVGVVVGAVVGAVVVVGVVVGAAVGLCVLEVVQTQQSHPLQPTAPSHTPAFTPCLQQMPSVPQ